MPTYSINMNAGDTSQGWDKAATSLARALTPDYDGQANAQLRAAQAQQAQGGAAANYALARDRNADAAGTERINQVWKEFDEVMGSDLDYSEKLQLFPEYLMRAGEVDGGNLGNFALASGGIKGWDDDRMNQLQLGSGMATGNTILGTAAAMKNDNANREQDRVANVIAAEVANQAKVDAAALANQNTIAATALENENAVTAAALEAQAKVDATALAQSNAVTNANMQNAFTAAEAARDRQAEDRAAGNELVEVIRDGKVVLIPRSQANGETPALSETDAKGASLQTAVPGEENFEGFTAAGLSAEANNVVHSLSDKVADGTATPRDLKMYSLAYNELWGDKLEIRETDEGPVQVLIRGQAPAGFPPPRDYRAPYTPGEASASMIEPTSPLAGDPALTAGPAPAPVAAPGPENRVSVTPIEGFPAKTAKAQTEAQARYGQYAARIKGGMVHLMDMLSYDVGSGELAEGGWRPSFWGGVGEDVLPNWAKPYALSEENQAFYTRVAQTLNPLIRADSGAAVPEGEYPRYYAQYVPKAGEPDSVVKAKMDHLLITQMAFEEISTTPEGKRALDTKDPSLTQQAMQAAKARIADEQGIAIAQFTYPVNGDAPEFVGVRQPGSGEIVSPGAAQAAPAAPAAGSTDGADPFAPITGGVLPGGDEYEVIQ